MRTDLVENALKMAITLRGQLPDHVEFPHQPSLAQYVSEQISKFATENGITRSMGLTGICWDAMAESFFATLKAEYYCRRVWPTEARAELAVGKWIEDRYNRRRRHSSIGQISPVAFELQYSTQIAADQKAA
jgi:putative transposase